MNNSDPLLSVGDFIFAVTVFPTIVFLLVYSVTAKWWRDPIGRMFVIAQSGIFVVSIVVLLSLVLGQDYPGRDWVRIVGYSLHLVGQVLFVTTYLRERRDPTGRLPKTRMDSK
ncbi:MAG: hypothetical protein JWO98_5343 [Frankiales bacterium]|nr:hypothetical protein [Frankiales bacterium]